MTDKEKGIVVNTSPWVVLSICGQISLLNKLYSEVYIPYSVKEEIMAGGEQGIGIYELRTCPWVKIEGVADVEKVNLLYELEKGEAEVIILSKKRYYFLGKRVGYLALNIIAIAKE